MEEGLPEEPYVFPASISDTAGQTIRQTLASYRQKLKNLTDHLMRADWQELDFQQSTLQVVISGIKDCIEVFDDIEVPIDINLNLEKISDYLYDVVAKLHVIAEAAQHTEYDIRKDRFSEIAGCIKVLKMLCKLLNL